MKKFSFLVVLILLVIGGTAVWWIGSTSAVNTADAKERPFVINKGESVREIATDLKNDGFIKDTVAFFLLIKTNGLDGKIQAGQFYISPAMNMQQIVHALQVGTHDMRITIPEGKRAEEIADVLEENFTSYNPSWRDILNKQEGYLFPDTYSFSKDATIGQIVKTMTDTFEAKYTTVTGPRKATLTKKEIVTIASLVEREARHDEDRPLVASVILNRYDIGMKLDIDATVQYALGYDKTKKRWWKQGITVKDLAISSAYNTYKTASLPPTPIANPGLKALQAVVDPAESEYIFYLTDSNGINHYAQTNDEHEANKQRYGL
jgi:UPF0755 protein